jgi:hypothetical protein
MAVGPEGEPSAEISRTHDPYRRLTRLLASSAPLAVGGHSQRPAMLRRPAASLNSSR